MKISRRAKLIVALVLWIPIGGLLGYDFLYQPLKFRYLIHRVESAKTQAEEYAAFDLAKRWGCCWELHLESPPGTWVSIGEVDSVVQDSQRKMAVELEWLESRPNGIPYRAHRTLIDKSSIYVLMGR